VRVVVSPTPSSAVAMPTSDGHVGWRTLSKVVPTTPGQPLDEMQMKRLVRKLEYYREGDIKKEHMLFMIDKQFTDAECEAVGIALKQLGPTDTEYIMFPTGHEEDGVGDRSAISVGEAIAAGACPKLQVIIMQESQLTDKGMVAMVQGLKKCPAFRDLVLNKNLLSDIGFTALTDVFLDGGFSRVEKLDLSGETFLKHQISDASFVRWAQAIAEGEIKLLDLKELNLQDSMIGDEGVTWLATALGRGNLPKLESLYLMGCPLLTDKCAAAIAEGIRARKKMPMLRDVRLGYSEVTQEGKELIKQAARDKGKKISVILQLLGGEVPDKD